MRGMHLSVAAAVAAVLTLAPATAHAGPFTVTPSNDATALAQAIVGTGVTLSGTPTLTGINGQSGTFVDFTTGNFTNPLTNVSGNITIDQGIILSSGLVANGDGNFAGGANSNLGGAGDAQLDAASGFQTEDAVALTFNFVPDANQIFIQFLFASTEYPTFVNTQFNDVFAFFVNGTNVALVPGTTDEVTINNINVGRPVGTNPSNQQFFTQYSQLGTPFNYGGATVLLTATANVNPNEVNTFKFAIADASDRNLDSAVFIGAGTFSTEEPEEPENPVPEPTTMSLLGLGMAAAYRARRRLA